MVNANSGAIKAKFDIVIGHDFVKVNAKYSKSKEAGLSLACT